MHGNSIKKDNENGQLSCGIYSSLARLGRRSPKQIQNYSRNNMEISYLKDEVKIADMIWHLMNLKTRNHIKVPLQQTHRKFIFWAFHKN